MEYKPKKPPVGALLIGFEQEKSLSYSCAMAESGKFYGAGGEQVHPELWSFAPIPDLLTKDLLGWFKVPKRR